MYLSKITPCLHGDQIHRLAALASAGAYGIHQALWRLFEHEADAKRDFLFRQLGVGDQLGFYLQSVRKPGTDNGLWSTNTKQFAPKLQQGQRLSFSLRINPVIKRRDDNGRQHRHDLIMDLKQQDRRSGQAREQVDRVQLAALQWLEQRQQTNGFQLANDSVIAEAYRQHRFRGHAGRLISMSTLDCKGVLTVSDVDLFLNTLSNGLGPGKAFGCGLLLIRPI